MPPRPQALVLCATIVLLPAAARAGLECGEPTADKGEVRSGVPLSHRFRVVNRGPEAVDVTDVKPSCGCLAPKMEKRRLGPGEVGELVLEVNTLTQPAGANSWRVTIHYKSGDALYELPLYVCARVVTEISVEPPSLAVYTDTAIGHEVRVIDRRTEPLIVRAVTASSPHVRTHLGELRRDGDGRWVRSIRVEVLADCPEGRHEESLHIYTSDPTYPELKVPFTVVKRSRHRVHAAPESVVLTEDAGRPLPSRIVLLSAADDAAVKIDRAEADNAAVECRWAQGPGTRATLKIRVDRGRIDGDDFRAAVRVHLSGPAPQTITIPVRCLLR